VGKQLRTLLDEVQLSANLITREASSMALFRSFDGSFRLRYNEERSCVLVKGCAHETEI